MVDYSNLDSKKRFAFGKNWARFLKNFDEERVVEAEKSLIDKLKINDLNGKTFLDIGSGSGLFSLAAYRLGAKVYSFDYDVDSVSCTKYLKERFSHSQDKWLVEQGSVLDQEFLKKFDPVDILYSWGVLHHTGYMYKAFENIIPIVKSGGTLFISIYNDQGGASRRWLKIKQLYQNSSFIGRFLLCCYTLIRQWWRAFIKDILTSGNIFKTWKNYGVNNRGMSPWHDIVDWSGGYPFEVAKPEEIFKFFKNKGFILEDLKTCAGGIGCNEYVFKKE